jgi:hypothetical protein
MAVTKAQLVVWALIAGLGVWGCSALSRVTLPKGALDSPNVVAAVAEAPTVRAVVAAPLATAGTLPATIPEFPFPDDLPTATIGNPAAVAAGTIAALADVSLDALPQIATASQFGVVAASEPAREPASTPAPIVAAVEEPPIPMPSRPLAALPVKAVPLDEVKTLYVVADTLNVRAVPSTEGPVLQKVPQGFAVAAREQSNEWIGFLMRDGSTGWMRTDYLSDTMPTPPIATSPVRVWTEPLNLMM